MDYEVYAMRAIQKMLSAEFGPTELSLEERAFQVNLEDEQSAMIDLRNMDILCEDPDIEFRLKIAVRRMQLALFPLPDFEVCC